MLRIDTSTKAPNLFGAGKHGFRPSNYALGQFPTQFSADWANAVQESICRVIENFGGVVGGDHDELYDAILGIASIGGAITKNASAVLTAGDRGVVTINASAANTTITLPPADQIMDFIVRRADNTANKCIVQGAGADVIMHNPWVNGGAGYAFLRLFGAGDYWWLRSDGNGVWMPMSRLDALPIGAPLPITHTMIPAGGYGKANGTIYVRADFPWLWDMASASGNIDTEANWSASKWGGYSTGDTATTMRILELRGEFIRVYDDGRGVDSGRSMGVNQFDALQGHEHTQHKIFAGLNTDAAPGGYGQATTPTVGITSDGVHGSPRVASETRGRNLALPHLLKLI